MGRGAAGSRESGGGRRRGAGPGREALPARASRPRPRRPGRAQQLSATRGRDGGGSAADTPSRPAPAAPRPAAPRLLGPLPPGAHLPWRPGPQPPAATLPSGCRAPARLSVCPAAPCPPGPSRAATAAQGSLPGAASASVAGCFSSFSLLAVWPVSRACFIFSFLFSAVSVSLPFSMSVSQCLPVSVLPLHPHPPDSLRVVAPCLSLCLSFALRVTSPPPPLSPLYPLSLLSVFLCLVLLPPPLPRSPRPVSVSLPLFLSIPLPALSTLLSGALPLSLLTLHSLSQAPPGAAGEGAPPHSIP